MVKQRNFNPGENYYRRVFRDELAPQAVLANRVKADDQTVDDVASLREREFDQLIDDDFSDQVDSPAPTPTANHLVVNVANFAKKSGPSWAVFGAVLVTLLTSLSMAFPALVPLQLAERLTETFDVQSLNSQTRIRKLSTYRFKNLRGPNDFIEARKSRLGFGRKHYRFSTMSDNQLKLWQEQGYRFELEETPSGQKRIVSVDIDDPEAPGGRRKITNAAEFNDRLMANPEWSNKHFNASRGKYGMYADKITKSVRSRLGITLETLSSKLKDGDLNKNKLETEQDNQIRHGTEAPDGPRARLQSELDEVKRKIDSGQYGGESLRELEERQARLTKAIDSIDDANQVKISGDASYAGIGKMLNVVDGVSDACGLYNLANRLIYAAKVAKSIHLSRYAAGFLTMASAVKAGDSTEEEMSLYLNNIMATNPIVTDYPDGSREVTDYEMNGLDSQAYRFMVDGYMDAPNQSFQQAQLGINDEKAIKGFLAVKAGIEEKAHNFGIPLNISQFCRVMDSFEVQALVIVGQAILAISTGGIGLAPIKLIEATKALAPTAFLWGTRHWLSAELQKGLGGNWVNSKTQGQDMVNSLAVGTAELSNKQAQASGNLPLGQNSAIEQTFAQRNLVNQKAAMIRKTHSPFDLTTRHTMMGSVVAGVLPYIGRMSSFLGNISSTWSYGWRSVVSLLPRVSALSEAEQAEAMRATMNYCQDPEYRAFAGLDQTDFNRKLGIYPFCSMMLGLPQAEANASEYSPHQVLEYLAPGTYERDANGKLTTVLKDYTIPYQFNESGYVTNYQQARQKGQQIDDYINGVLKDGDCDYDSTKQRCKTYFKPVDRDGNECSLVPIILDDGRVIARGFAGLNTEAQMDNPCLDETGLNYEFEWAIDDRDSANGYYIRQDFVSRREGNKYVLYYTDEHLTRPLWRVSHRSAEYNYYNRLKRHTLNPLLSFKVNCIDRGEVPYGMRELDQMASEGDVKLGEQRDGQKLGDRLFGGLFGKLINSGDECVLRGRADTGRELDEEQKRRLMFALYFMDERVQCMLDGNQNCAGDIVGRQYTAAGDANNDDQSGWSGLPDLRPGDDQRDANGCQSPPAGTLHRYVELTDDEIRRITAAMMSEQGSSVKAIAFEASLLANLTDKSKKFKSPKSYLLNSGWFNKRNVRRSYKEGRKCNGDGCGERPTPEMIAVVDSVLRGGKRLTVADEHDTFSDIAWIKTGNKKYTDRKDIQNRANYVSGQTIIGNRFGSRYRFDCFPSADADPFGQKIGG